MSKIIWDKYLEFEKNHKEDVQKTRQFFVWILDNYAKYIKNNKFHSVLEIGNGQSGGFKGLIDYDRYISVDPLFGDLMIKAEDMDFGVNKFDLIIISNTLSHCDNLEKVVNKIQYYLRSTGKIFLFNYYNEDNNHPHVFNNKDDILTLFPRLKVREISEDKGGKGRNPFVVIILEK